MHAKLSQLVTVLDPCSRKNKQTKNNPHQVDDRCQAKGSKELITKQTTSSSDKH